MKNESNTVISNVIVSGTGFSQTITAIPPLRSASVSVRPAGESGVSLSFSTPQGLVSTNHLGYIETQGGYWAEFIVAADYSIRFKNGISVF